MTWDGYLEGFHAARPGITESVLRRARGTSAIWPRATLSTATATAGAARAAAAATRSVRLGPCRAANQVQNVAPTSDP